MISFKDLKKKREENFNKINSKLKSVAEPSFNAIDERFWKPVVDKEQNGYAVIRFLPTTAEDLEKGPKDSNGDSEALPFVKYWDHGFEGPAGWYIENSLSSIGLPDPCGEMNARLWSTGLKENKDFVSGTPSRSGSKRRLHFISNIFIASHPAKKEDEGKVFLFQYGKKIFDKLNEASNPKFPHLKPINPFDLWEGANFRLCIKKVDGYRSYSDSSFDVKGPILDDDVALEKIWKSQYPLLPFLDPSKFKTYEVLSQRLKLIMGERTAPVTQRAEDQTPIPSIKSKTAPRQEEEQTPPFDIGEEDEEGLDFFKNLVNK